MCGEWDVANIRHETTSLVGDCMNASNSTTQAPAQILPHGCGVTSRRGPSSHRSKWGALDAQIAPFNPHNWNIHAFKHSFPSRALYISPQSRVSHELPRTHTKRNEPNGSNQKRQIEHAYRHVNVLRVMHDRNGSHGTAADGLPSTDVCHLRLPSEIVRARISWMISSPRSSTLSQLSQSISALSGMSWAATKLG